jgi:hypothetical protein
VEVGRDARLMSASEPKHSDRESSRSQRRF